MQWRRPDLKPARGKHEAAYRDVLSDREIWDSLAYIKSRWPPRIQESHADIDRRAKQKRN